MEFSDFNFQVNCFEKNFKICEVTLIFLVEFLKSRSEIYFLAMNLSINLELRVYYFFPVNDSFFLYRQNWSRKCCVRRWLSLSFTWSYFVWFFYRSSFFSLLLHTEFPTHILLKCFFDLHFYLYMVTAGKHLWLEIEL